MNCNARAAFVYLISVVRSRLGARVILRSHVEAVRCAAVHSARDGAARGACAQGDAARSARHSRRGRHSADTYRSQCSVPGARSRARTITSPERQRAL